MSNSITMDYYPRNEGEQANYLFTITLESTTDLTSSMSFLVRFPNDYDPNLFLYEPVAESEQLIGALHTKVLHRHVRITGKPKCFSLRLIFFIRFCRNASYWTNHN